MVGGAIQQQTLVLLLSFPHTPDHFLPTPPQVDLQRAHSTYYRDFMFCNMAPPTAASHGTAHRCLPSHRPPLPPSQYGCLWSRLDPMEGVSSRPKGAQGTNGSSMQHVVASTVLPVLCDLASLHRALTPLRAVSLHCCRPPLPPLSLPLSLAHRILLPGLLPIGFRLARCTAEDGAVRGRGQGSAPCKARGRNGGGNAILTALHL